MRRPSAAFRSCLSEREDRLVAGQEELVSQAAREELRGAAHLALIGRS